MVIVDGWLRSECGDGSMEIVSKLFPNYQEPHDVEVVGGHITAVHSCSPT